MRPTHSNYSVWVGWLALAWHESRTLKEIMLLTPTLKSRQQEYTSMDATGLQLQGTSSVSTATPSLTRTGTTNRQMKNIIYILINLDKVISPTNSL